MFMLIAADTAQHNTVRQHQTLCRHSHDTAGSTSTAAMGMPAQAVTGVAPGSTMHLRVCAVQHAGHAVHAGSRCAEVTKVRL
jgi:hypothetical protein